jgi:Lrp/AsnC family leucine-responsive transcriptional regulator
VVKVGAWVGLVAVMPLTLRRNARHPLPNVAQYDPFDAMLLHRSGATLSFMPEQRYDKTDRAILSILQREGRIPNVELADRVALSPSSCLRRTKTLEADGIISGYRAELDRKQLGLGLTVFVSLRVSQHSRETSRSIEEALTAIPAVVACHVISGEADFLVEAVIPNLGEFESLLLDQILAIDAVTDARSTFAIRTVLSRGALPLHALP